MALPTSVPETAESAYLRVVAIAASAKSNLSGVANLLGPNPPSPITMDNLIGLYQALNASQAVGLSIQGVGGLSDYAKDKLGADYDINAQFMASIIACKTVTDWLLANMPGDGKGGYTGWQHRADGTIGDVTLNPATLAPLASLITAALATFA
ncbi:MULTISPECIES: hypothetical protein [unclassified Methylobacterium]|uniref:hypothetical protein n=1 Tax=unclassified Methylobacterium TaxID=2615210 RepID=UPI00226A9F6F|nr:MULTISPECIES: hypothetical protein [unclassified Methylobacterium]